MAFYTSDGFDPLDLSFLELANGEFRGEPDRRDTRFLADGPTLPDGSELTFDVRGEDFQYDGVTGRPTAGSIDSIRLGEQKSDGTLATQFTISGTDVPVEKLLAVGATEGLRDDFGLLKTMLKGADVLRGSLKADTLLGFRGDDTIDGGDGGDFMSGDRGFDIVTYAQAGRAVTASLFDDDDNGGGARGDDFRSIEGLVGSAFADRLTGDSKANSLEGGAGRDTLEGGRGSDDYLMTAALLPENADVIRGFVSGKDEIWLSSDIFAGLTADDGGISSRMFVYGRRAADLNDHLIYAKSKGQLFFDVDGRGGEDQVLIAQLGRGVELTRGDFELF